MTTLIENAKLNLKNMIISKFNRKSSSLILHKKRAKYYDIRKQMVLSLSFKFIIALHRS